MPKISLYKTSLISIFLLFGVGCAFGGVVFEITPKNPVRGDVVTIEGLSSPGDKVKIEISFEKTVSVKNGTFIFSIKGIEIPTGENRFYVIAKKALNLDISVRRKIIGEIYTPWITISRSATNDCVSFSQSIPPGNYDIIIHGMSENDNVVLKFIAVGYAKCDENGRFKYSYDTSSMPLGKFKVTIDGVTRYVVLNDKRETQDIKKPIRKETSKLTRKSVTSAESNTSKSELKAETGGIKYAIKNSIKETSEQTISKNLTNSSAKLIEQHLVNKTKKPEAEKVENEKDITESKSTSNNIISNISKNENLAEIKAFNESKVEKKYATSSIYAAFYVMVSIVLAISLIYLLRR